MNESYHPSPARKPNPITQRKHRQEVLWQITLPLLVGVLVILVITIGVVIAGIRGTGDVSRLASVSFIWLVIPAMLLTFIFLVVVGALAYGLARLIGILPGYTRIVQDFFILVSARVRQAADAAVEPVLRAKSYRASLRALRRK
jgi:amino acid transporter